MFQRQDVDILLAGTRRECAMSTSIIEVVVGAVEEGARYRIDETGRLVIYGIEMA